MAAIATFYLLTREESVKLYGASAVGFRYNLAGTETFASKTASDKKAKKLGLQAMLAGKYVYTDEERREIMDTPEWTAPDEGEV